MYRHVVLPATLLALSLVACGQREDNSPTSDNTRAEDMVVDAASTSDTQAIAWFKGSVEEAFAHAREQSKPIFLYWGAEWCPPCHEIKVTVFNKREFIERSRLFVPVYLDGDTDNAQEIGEKFGVLGYPTMVVFSSDGEEITRIPGGIDIQAYANILDLTLGNTRPVATLLSNVLDHGASLSGEDCRLMAYYSWGQDTAILKEREAAEVFHALAAACPAQTEVERSILYVNYLDEAVDDSEDPENRMPLPESVVMEASAQINALLDNYGAAKANVYPVIFKGAVFTGALTEPGSEERAAMTAKFLGIYERMKNDTTMFKTERLYALRGKLRFERLENPEAVISDGLQKEIRDMVAWADQTTPDPYERQSVINAASNVLFDANMLDEARALLLAALDKSTQPYYFMVSLADLEQEAGNNEQALRWFRRAYDESTGPATRFQWGIYWLTGLIQMTPDDEKTIAAGTLRVFGEIESSKAFYQRPKRQMQSLEQSLRDWNADDSRRASIVQIRQSISGICTGIPESEPARVTCESFLADPPEPGAS